MFERFTEHTRDVLVSAQALAKDLRSPQIRRHHLLIGLLDTSEEGSDVVATMLDNAEIDRADLRAKLLASLKATEEPVSEAGGKMPFTAETKKALELSLREALALGHNYIGRAHLLLGILRAVDGPLGEVLATTKLTHESAHAVVVDEIPPVFRVRRGPFGRDVRREVREAMRGREALRMTPGLNAAFRRAFDRAGKDRKVNTGDFLVALLETPGTHFAAALSSLSLPAAATIIAEADRLFLSGVADGTEDAVQVDPQSGSVTVNDPQIAAELKRLVGEGGVTPEALREILRRLQSGD